MRGWRKTPLGTAGWVVLPGIPNFTISGEQILSKLSVVAITTVLALAVLSSRSFAVTNAVVGTCKARTSLPRFGGRQRGHGG
jgi:hypothetical protein